ncbi:nucleoid-associated protein [Crenobacter luteus]|uniref:Nucleoid-associated protein n=1 Tax=Crenobacter luteus TaxID=1452487 RepID=A0A161SBV4_9NEIS|nr:nucleoid-associated protein [Crenobacter luteus]KZE33533.1 hypothetical protein AVW16_08330 [Crenobacter luteus]
MMIGDAKVERLVVHRVGNPARDERLQLSDRAATVDDEVSALLLDGYLKGIVSDKKKHQFFHESDLNLNELYHYSRQFFRGEVDFLDASQRIARHLYARSQHPNISSGDLLVILFSGLSDGETAQRALGVFKSEIRDEFLTLIDSGDVIDIRHASGINPRLIDKGALLLENGPTVYAVDRLGQQAKFWLDDFLKAMRVPDAASRSRMVATVVEQLSDGIADPLEQARFKEACFELCVAEDEVAPGEVARLAERFVPRERVEQVRGEAAESYGFALDDEAKLPALGVARRLEKTLSRVGVGHGINLLMPSHLSLKHFHTLDDGEGEMTLTIKLRRRD